MRLEGGRSGLRVLLRSAGWRKEGELAVLFGWCRLLGVRSEPLGGHWGLQWAAARGTWRGGRRAGQTLRWRLICWNIFSGRNAVGLSRVSWADGLAVGRLLDDGSILGASGSAGTLPRLTPVA